MLWLIVIYLASAVFCIHTLKQSIDEGIEDGDIDDINADLMYTFGKIVSFIPLINTFMASWMLGIYIADLIPLFYERVKYFVRIKYLKIKHLYWKIRRK
jgi:hypothetical protein